jgi:hypothetical protein
VARSFQTWIPLGSAALTALRRWGRLFPECAMMRVTGSPRKPAATWLRFPKTRTAHFLYRAPSVREGRL